MSYPLVIALLDAQLERLRTVRDLLTSDPPQTRGRKKDLVDPLEVVAQLELKPLAAPVAPEPTRIAARQRRERRTAPRKNRAESGSALNGTVPLAPVYVSADKVRSAQAQKDEAREEQTKREPLTAEMLSQKWFHSSAT